MDGPSDDAVHYFSDNAQEFTGLYAAQPEFADRRVAVWHDLLDRYSDPDGLSVDMGCGPGIFSFYLAAKGGQVVGIDGASGMVELCESQRLASGVSNVRFERATLPDVDERGLDNASLVISSSVVEYVDDLDRTLGLFARLLAPGGVLIVSMPNVISLSRTYLRLKHRLTGEPEIYTYIRHFSCPTLLRRRVRRLGLDYCEAHYYTHFTRLARMAHAAHLPAMLTEDLFVAVFRKTTPAQPV